MTDNETLNNLAKGFGIVTLGIFISKILTYFYRALVARTLGPEAYGELSLALMVLGIVNTFALLSMGTSLRQKLPQAPEMEEKIAYIRSAFQLSVPVALLFSICLFLLSDLIAVRIFDAPGLSILIKTLSIVPLANSFSYISVHTFLAIQKPKYKVLINQILQNLIQLLGTAAFIALNFGILGAALGWLTGSLITAIIAVIVLWKKFFPDLFRLKNLESKRKELLKFSAPLMMSGAISTSLAWTDTFFLGFYLDSTQVGFYNAALPIALLLTIPLTAFGNISLPSLSAEVKKGKKKVEETVKTLARWTFMFTFPAFIGVALFAEEALKLLFGSEYTVASVSLVILSIGFMVSSFTSRVGDVLTTYERTDLVFVNTLLSLAINVPLNILLIPQYGIVGAAAATTISRIFSNIIIFCESVYIFDINPLSLDLIKPILASIPPLVLVYSITKNLFNIVPIWALIPSAIAFGLLYFLVLIIIRGLNDEDKEVIVNFGETLGYKKESKKLANLICRG